jgi:peptidoglycan/xylan/chitin deacetylase (PgdA/CDA1 family)
MLMLVMAFLNQAFAQKLSVTKAQNFWSGSISIEDPVQDVLKIKTAGNGEPSYVGWTLNKSINMENHFFKALVKISDLETWSGIELRMSSSDDTSEYFAISIPLFTKQSFNYIQPGAWQAITLTMGEARKIGNPDINNITKFNLYVQDKAKGSFEISLSGVELLPVGDDAIISITFDDGYDETLDAARIMEKYNLRGTAYIMPNVDEKAGYLNKSEIIALADVYGWGISAHHAIPFTDLSPGQLDKEIDGVLDYLNELGMNYSSAHLAFPLGQTNHDYVMPISRGKFKTSRIAGGGGETLPPADWHRLRVFNVLADTKVSEIKARIEKAKIHKEWLIFMFHYLDEEITPNTPGRDLHYTYDNFKAAIKVISESNVLTLPVHEVWEGYQVN